VYDSASDWLASAPSIAFAVITHRAGGFPWKVTGAAEFTGKERDGETGLDYFGARYYSGAQGRFTSPDNFLNDTTALDPQRWNLYAYARNNPLRYVDPNGEKVYAGDLSAEDQEDKEQG
jgi:RHS repeat-associated protein